MRPFFESQHPQTSARGSLAPLAPDHVDPVVLSAGALYRHPLPAGARVALISFDGDVWARAGVVTDSIAVPTSTAMTGLAGELSPGARRLPDDATHLLLVADAARKGSLAFYA